MDARSNFSNLVILWIYGAREVTRTWKSNACPVTGVAGFGDFEVSRYSTPSISTVKFDAAELGRVAADLIVKLIDPEQSSQSLSKRFEITVSNCMRESTRAQ